MKKLIIFITFFSALTFISGTLYAKIVVEDIKGEAAYKKGNQWVPLTKGLLLEEGTKISTGIKSWALLNINGDSVKINQLTMMKIYKNQLTATDKNTQIALKHGSLKARVNKLGTLKTSFKITTPVATSSVRGTTPVPGYGSKSGYLGYVEDGQMEVIDQIGHSSIIEGNLVCQQGPNDPRSRHLLLNERNRSIPNVTDPNATKEEKGTLEFTGLGTLTPGDNPGGFVPPSSSHPSSTVNIQIGW